MSDDGQDRREYVADELENAAAAIDTLHVGDVTHADDGDLRGLRDGLRSWATDLREAYADE